MVTSRRRRGGRKSWPFKLGTEAETHIAPCVMENMLRLLASVPTPQKKKDRKEERKKINMFNAWLSEGLTLRGHLVSRLACLSQG